MTLQYLETVVASTAVICEEIGVMMYERQYITFAESIEGGRMSVVQATFQWGEWLNTALEKNATWPPSDLKGPSGQRRIWVKTQDVMKFQNKLERQKAMQLKDKEEKNASEELLERTNKRIQLDHDFMGGKGFAGSLQDQGSAMMKAGGGGNVFTNHAMELPDIEELDNQEEEAELEDEDEEGDEGEEGGDALSASGRGDQSGQDPPAKKQKAAAWFDFDKSVAEAQRNFVKAHQTFNDAVTWARQDAQVTLKTYNELPQDTKANMLTEHRVLQGRCDALTFVQYSKSDKLKQMIQFHKSGAPQLSAPSGAVPDASAAAACSNSPAKAASPANSESISGRALLGFAAPCASYMQLVTMLEMEVMSQEFLEVQCQEDIKALNTKVAKTRAPAKELLAKVIEATKDLNDLITEETTQDAASGKKGKGKQAKAAKANLVRKGEAKPALALLPQLQLPLSQAASSCRS